MKNPRSRLSAATTISMIIVAFVVRVRGLDFVSDDLKYFFLPWYARASAHGFAAIGETFYNYTPPYVTLLWLASFFERFLPPHVLVKLPSLVFEILMAIGVGRLVANFGDPARARSTFWRGFAWVYLWPTVILNGAVWGQCDALYAVGILFALGALNSSRVFPRSFAAHSFFGMSFIFKLQSIFVAPLYLVLYFCRKINPFHLLLVPFIYVLAMLPAFFAGRSADSLVRVYLDQGEVFRSLSMNAPTFYAWISDSHYDFVFPFGVIFAGITLFGGSIYFARRYRQLNGEAILALGAFFAWLSPSLLPKMHERYFYLAEILSLALALVVREEKRVVAWAIAVFVEIASLVTYSRYLFQFDGITRGQAPFFHGAVAVLWFIYFSERSQSESEPRR